jgi:hypothetical protein
MARNVGTVDRVTRVVLGLVVFVGALLVERGGIGWALAALALIATIAVLTGAIGFCPIYRAVGLDTRRSPGSGA